MGPVEGQELIFCHIGIAVAGKGLVQQVPEIRPEPFRVVQGDSQFLRHLVRLGNGIVGHQVDHPPGVFCQLLIGLVPEQLHQGICKLILLSQERCQLLPDFEFYRTDRF